MVLIFWQHISLIKKLPMNLAWRVWGSWAKWYIFKQEGNFQDFSSDITDFKTFSWSLYSFFSDYQSSSRFFQTVGTLYIFTFYSNLLESVDEGPAYLQNINCQCNSCRSLISNHQLPSDCSPSTEVCFSVVTTSSGTILTTQCRPCLICIILGTKG
jgi:hypothetical protein